MAIRSESADRHDGQLAALHLCSGYGGFELALRGIARTVCHVERDAYAAATLVARMESAQLDQAPVWSDLNTFDARAWRGRVDIVTAGFPCQPFSAAGKKRGTDDDRWLWPAIAQIIEDVACGWVFLENVPQVVKHGLPWVAGDLAEMGFDAEWGLLSAAQIGAPHKRERWWLVARHETLADDDDDGRAVEWRQPERREQSRGDLDRSGGEDVADTEHDDRRADIERRNKEGRTPARWSGPNVGDASGIGRRRSWLGPGSEEQSRRLTYSQIADHRFPPRPDDINGWQRWQGAQPSVRRGTDGSPEWLADALHLGGNGLVPQCARVAWRQLCARLADPPLASPGAGGAQ